MLRVQKQTFPAFPTHALIQTQLTRFKVQKWIVISHLSCILMLHGPLTCRVWHKVAQCSWTTESRNGLLPGPPPIWCVQNAPIRPTRPFALHHCLFKWRPQVQKWPRLIKFRWASWTGAHPPWSGFACLGSRLPRLASPSTIGNSSDTQRTGIYEKGDCLSHW